MKILSIDFNIIMSGCIKLYADKINTNEAPKLIWDYLNDVYEMDKYTNIDARILSAIVTLIKKNKSAKFTPIISPHAIVDEVIKLNNPVDIINIDFFHDLVNEEKEIEEWKNDKFTDLNWLGYLIYKDKVENCTWIKAPNSFRCNNHIEDDVTIMNISDIKELDSDFDIIYFTLSPHFVPYKYEYIFKLICEIFAEEKEEHD